MVHFVEEVERRNTGAGPGKRIGFSVVTNLMVATDDQLAWCGDHGVRVSYTLNGPREIHDHYRVTRAGTGSYLVVMNRVEQVRANRACCSLRRDVAAIEQFEDREEFVAEIILAAADAGERRGRADHRAIADERAVVGFDAPDRRDDVAVDPVLLLDRVEDRLVLRENGAAVRDAIVVHQDVEVIPERFGELGLGIEQVHDPQIRREAGDGGVEHRARHAAALGLRPQRGEAAAEIGRRRADRLRRHLRVIGGAGFAAPFQRRRGRRGLRRAGCARPIEQRADVEALGERRRRQGGGSQGCRAEQAHRSGKSRHGVPRILCCVPRHGDSIWLRAR